MQSKSVMDLMPVIKNECVKDFSIVPNELSQLAQTGEISYEAVGLLLDMISRPTNWTFHKDFYITKIAGRRVIDRIFKELQTLGYLKIEDARERGQFSERIWCVSNKPIYANNEINSLNINTDIENSLNINNDAKISLNNNDPTEIHIYRTSVKPKCGKCTPTNKETTKIKDKDIKTEKTKSIVEKKILSDFEEYWSVHPRRITNDSKSQALQEWKKLMIKLRQGKVCYTVDQIIVGTLAYKEYCEKYEQDREYILSGKRFLRDEEFLTEWKNVKRERKPIRENIMQTLQRLSERGEAVELPADDIPF